MKIISLLSFFLLTTGAVAKKSSLPNLRLGGDSNGRDLASKTGTSSVQEVVDVSTPEDSAGIRRLLTYDDDIIPACSGYNGKKRACLANGCSSYHKGICTGTNSRNLVSTPEDSAGIRRLLTYDDDSIPACSGYNGKKSACLANGCSSYHKGICTGTNSTRSDDESIPTPCSAYNGNKMACRLAPRCSSYSYNGICS